MRRFLPALVLLAVVDAADLLVYLPSAAEGPVPAIIGLNFWGNHAIHSDPGIRLTESWVNEQPATEASRGINAKQWPVEEILERRYALATIYREDVCADRTLYFQNGGQSLFPELQKGGENFGCIAAWAWSLSRALDVLEKEPVFRLLGADGLPCGTMASRRYFGARRHRLPCAGR